MSMLSDVRELLEHTDIPVHGEAIAEALALLDLMQAKVAAAVAQYDAQGLAVLDGAHSTIGFLKQCGVAQPSNLVKVARRVEQLPVTKSMWLRGELTSGQVQAIVANVNDDVVDQLAADEPELMPLLRPLSVHDVCRVMREWKASTESAPSESERSAHLSELLDGRGRLDADLDAEGMALASAALRLAESPDAEGETRTASRRRADALVDVFRFFLDHQHDVPKHRVRPHVSLVVDWDRYSGSYSNGTPVAPALIRSTLCDANVNRVVTTGRSTILDYGTTTRLFSDAQFNALALRDQHCRHPGCDRPPQWCEAHHVIPVEAGGPTDIANGVLKCTRHHHIGHQPGWTEKLEPDGTYHLTAPDGRTWTTHAPGVRTLALV